MATTATKDDRFDVNNPADKASTAVWLGSLPREWTWETFVREMRSHAPAAGSIVEHASRYPRGGSPWAVVAFDTHAHAAKFFKHMQSTTLFDVCWPRRGLSKEERDVAERERLTRRDGRDSRSAPEPATKPAPAAATDAVPVGGTKPKAAPTVSVAPVAQTSKPSDDKWVVRLSELPKGFVADNVKQLLEGAKCDVAKAAVEYRHGAPGMDAVALVTFQDETTATRFSRYVNAHMASDKALADKFSYIWGLVAELDAPPTTTTTTTQPPPQKKKNTPETKPQPLKIDLPEDTPRGTSAADGATSTSNKEAASAPRYPSFYVKSVAQVEPFTLLHGNYARLVLVVHPTNAIKDKKLRQTIELIVDAPALRTALAEATGVSTPATATASPSPLKAA